MLTVLRDVVLPASHLLASGAFHIALARYSAVAVALAAGLMSRVGLINARRKR